MCVKFTLNGCSSTCLLVRTCNLELTISVIFCILKCLCSSTCLLVRTFYLIFIFSVCLSISKSLSSSTCSLVITLNLIFSLSVCLSISFSSIPSRNLLSGNAIKNIFVIVSMIRTLKSVNPIRNSLFSAFCSKFLYPNLSVNSGCINKLSNFAI